MNSQIEETQRLIAKIEEKNPDLADEGGLGNLSTLVVVMKNQIKIMRQNDELLRRVSGVSSIPDSLLKVLD